MGIEFFHEQSSTIFNPEPIAHEKANETINVHVEQREKLQLTLKKLNYSIILLNHFMAH